jgi:hypothetical protein
MLRALLLAAAVLLTGCGEVDARVGSPAPPELPALRTVGGEVQSIQRVGERALELTLRLWTDDPGCPGNPQARLDAEENGVVFVTTTYDIDATRECADSMATASVTTVTPLGDRHLAVDQRTWAPTEGAGYRLCDATLGCDPQPAGCDDDSYRLALDAGDFPRNGRTWTARACSPPWLVLDVDLTASGCAATGDAPESNPCLSGPARITRWVFVHRGPLWDTAAVLPPEGGCGDDPPQGLPRALCSDLPPVGSP